MQTLAHVNGDFLNWSFIAATLVPVSKSTAGPLVDTVVMPGDSGASVYIVDDGTCIGTIQGYAEVATTDPANPAIVCALITPLPQLLKVR
jgi:hypothetical protein